MLETGFGKMNKKRGTFRYKSAAARDARCKPQNTSTTGRDILFFD